MSKLCRGRQSGSELQARDGRDLLDDVDDLDLDYLRTWADELGVRQQLEALRGQ